MTWDECLDEEKIRKATPDTERAKSLTEIAKAKLQWLSSQKIDEVSASPILSNYFDALSELCDAILIARGFKISPASRECIVAFLKEILHEDLASEIFDHYRKIRNRINYYGKKVNPDLAMVGAKEINEVFSKLLSKHTKLR